MASEAWMWLRVFDGEGFRVRRAQGSRGLKTAAGLKVGGDAFAAVGCGRCFSKASPSMVAVGFEMDAGAAAGEADLSAAAAKAPPAGVRMTNR